MKETIMYEIKKCEEKIKELERIQIAEEHVKEAIPNEIRYLKRKIEHLKQTKTS
jgi:hypothetical protein